MAVVPSLLAGLLGVLKKAQTVMGAPRSLNYLSC